MGWYEGLRTLSNGGVSIRIGEYGRGLFNGPVLAPYGIPFVDYGGLCRFWTDYDPERADALACTQLLENNDIFCGCTPDAQCECHANVLAHPSRATAVPEWLSM
jgi:hypothetical protein